MLIIYEPDTLFISQCTYDPLPREIEAWLAGGADGKSFLQVAGNFAHDTLQLVASEIEGEPPSVMNLETNEEVPQLATIEPVIEGNVFTGLPTPCFFYHAGRRYQIDDGLLELEIIEPGDHPIEFRADGYKPLSMTWSVS